MSAFTDKSTPMINHEYLVEMSIAPSGNVATPTEGAAFMERFVLPTLEASQRLLANGTIAAGGPIAGSMGFAFIVRAASPQALEDVVTSLPLWPRAQTRVVPLGRFEARATLARARLAALRAAAHPLPVATTNN